MSRTAKPKKGMGKRLKNLREEKGKTQPEMAHDLKYAIASISRWEREKGSPQAEQLYELAEYFDVSLDFLVYGDDEQNVTATNVHSPALHKFLATTAAGKWASAQPEVLELLLGLRWPEPSVELYRSVTNAVRSIVEAANDDDTTTSSGQKRPHK